MNIVITGVTGLGNRGVEALLRPILDWLHRRFPDAGATVLTLTPDYDSRRLEVPGVRHLMNDFWFAPEREPTLRRRLGALLGRELRPTNAQQAIQSSSLVIAAGGDVFGSDYGDMEQHLRALRFARKHHVPVVFLGQSIGPFKTSSETEAWLEVARYSPLVTTREQLSYRYITSELGLSVDKVHLTADPAFLLEPPPKATTAALLEYYGIVPNRPKVALSISRSISGFGGVNSSDHNRAWCRLIDLIINEWRAQVVLVPHVQPYFSHADDRVAASLLVEKFGYDPRIRMIGGDHSASEFKGIISACDMLVAERMHAAIAGFSSAVPTLVVGYSVKSRGIVADMLGSNHQDYGVLIPIGDFVKSDKTVETARRAWETREEIGTRIKISLPEILRRARMNFDLLEECWFEPNYGNSVQARQYA